MSEIPLLPSSKFCQVDSGLLPNGLSMPRPVTTTRLMRCAASERVEYEWVYILLLKIKVVDSELGINIFQTVKTIQAVIKPPEIITLV